MADRSVTVRLKAEVDSFKSGMQSAASASKQAASEFDQVGRRSQQAGKATSAAWSSTGSAVGGSIGSILDLQRRHSAEWNTVANAATVGGAAVVGSVGLVAKAAIDWESAWTGVLKTVDGTPQQLSAVEDGLRGMARELPSTHSEIAAVAEAAGQLGVETDNVVAFSRTMIDMGETTNLSADEAATSIARFTNIMGTVGKYGEESYSRVGSAMVALGNNFATTESEINAMSLRLAGAGQQMGLTEGETLGLSAAMSSVGIEAEAGGTAMSMSLKKIDSAVRNSSEELDTFAQVAGMSAEEFAAKWQESPAQALDAFVQGLGRVQESGGSVAGTLDELGIKGIREQDTFLRLAGASDILTAALAMGNDAFEENTALAEEAALRYGTAESKIKIAWNSIKDAAITAGGAVAPIVATMADGISDLAGWFADLPPAVTGTATVLAGLAGVAALVVGSVMKLVTWGAAAAGTLTALSGAARLYGGAAATAATSSGLLAATLGPLSLMAGIFGAGYAAISLVGSSLEKSAIGAEALQAAIEPTGASIEKLDAAFQGAEWANGDYWSGTQEGIGGVGDAVDRLADGSKWNDLNGSVGHFFGYDTSWEKMKEDVSGVDQALADMAGSGNFEGAANNFEKISEKARDAGRSNSDLIELFPQLSGAVQEYADQVGVTLTEQELLDAMMGELPAKLTAAAGGSEQAAAGLAEAAGGMGELGDAAAEADQSLSDVIDSLTALGALAVDEGRAMSSYQESLANVGQVAQEIAESAGQMGSVLNEQRTNFDLTNEAGRKAQEAFYGVRDSGIEAAQAIAENSGSYQEIQAQLQGTYDQLINTAGQFGIFGAEADELARSVMGIPSDVSIETWMGQEAQFQALQTSEAINSIPPEKWVTISAQDLGSVSAIQNQINAMHGTSPKVLVTDQGSIPLTQSQINGILGKTTKIAVTDEGTVYQTQGKIDGVTDGDATIFVDDNGTVHVVQGDINSVADGSATIQVGETGLAAVQYSIQATQGKKVYIDVVERHSSLAGTSHDQGYATGGLVGYATGGLLPGGHGVRGFASGTIPGTPPAAAHQDNLLARVMDTGELIGVRSREFITNQTATEKNLPWLQWMNAGGVMSDLPGIAAMQDMGQFRGFAGGGSINAAKNTGGFWDELRRLAKQHPDREYFEDGTWRARNGRESGIWDYAYQAKVAREMKRDPYEHIIGQLRKMNPGRTYWEDGTWSDKKNPKVGGTWDQVYQDEVQKLRKSKAGFSWAAAKKNIAAAGKGYSPVAGVGSNTKKASTAVKPKAPKAKSVPAISFTGNSTASRAGVTGTRAFNGSTDGRAIGDAVASAMRSWQPVVSIDGRKFYGAMQQAGRQFGTRA